MAVYFRTDNPAGLLKSFNDRIAQDDPAGKITTWERVKNAQGHDFYTHKAPSWSRKAWFKPVIEQGTLRFNIIKPETANITTPVYAYYHGHLTETFLAHFDRNFTDAISGALPRVDDVVSSPTTSVTSSR